MLTEDQKENIAVNIKNFQSRVSQYLEIKEELEKYETMTAMLDDELSEVAEEERQIETAVDVLYRQTKKVSKTKEIENQISNCIANSKKSIDLLNRIEPELLELMRNLPIPVNLEKLDKHDSEISFPYFDGLEWNESTIYVIAELIRQKLPLDFGDVTILPDKVTVRGVDNKQDAIQKLVDAIQTFRIRVDNLSKSYEKIDALIERLTKSKLYPLILGILAEKGQLSAQDIAKILNVDERTVYDGCYNLTRSNWSPTPIQKLSSGQWELTLAGKILVDRLFEKHPQLKPQKIPKESVE